MEIPEEIVVPHTQHHLVVVEEVAEVVEEAEALVVAEEVPAYLAITVHTETILQATTTEVVELIQD